MQETENYKVLSTKVSSDTYELLNRLAKGKGMRVYELMQMCADTLVRYMSDCTTSRLRWSGPWVCSST